MKALVSSHLPQKKWRRLSILFLSLLPALAVFHLVMWFCFTRTLFRVETGDSKRVGYLVGLEDCKEKLKAREPQTGFKIVSLSDQPGTAAPRIVYFGDSFGAQLAKACSIRWHEPIGGMAVDWSNKNGLSQVMDWIRSGWFRDHGVKVIMLERVECEWLDTFADPGDSSLNVPLRQVLAEGGLPPAYEKATPWTFANNGNFKVLIDNFAYLFSPTAFNMTDTCVVHLNTKFFDCSYGKLLLFYRGNITHGVSNTKKNLPRFEQALANLKKLSDLCRGQGLKFYLIVPPDKASLYYDWVIHPFYPRSGTLDMLQARAASYGYVDLGKPFHEKLEGRFQDFYYPDDLHWNYPAAEAAAEELSKVGAGPSP